MRTLIDDVYREFIRGKPCVVAVALGRVNECKWIVQFCHLKHSGMGGKDVPDRGNGWPGCLKHHDESHTGIKSFERKYRPNLRRVCKILLAEFLHGVELPELPWGHAVADL